MRQKVTVIGSANVDILIQTDIFPMIDKLFFVKKLANFQAGKELTKLLPAARLGADVIFISAFGNDETGQFLIDTLTKEQLDLSFSSIIENQATGKAYIISCDGKNQIIVDQSANQYMTCDYIDSIAEILIQNDISLVQLEIPLKQSVIFVILHTNIKFR